MTSIYQRVFIKGEDLSENITRVNQLTKDELRQLAEEKWNGHLGKDPLMVPFKEYFIGNSIAFFEWVKPEMTGRQIEVFLNEQTKRWEEKLDHDRIKES